jgi:hypothetical protein
LLDDDGERLLPRALLMLPGWRFGYAFDVAGSASPAMAASAPADGAAPIPAPPIRFGYQLHASTEAL